MIFNSKIIVLSFISLFFFAKASLAEVDVYFLPRQKNLFVDDLVKYFNQLSFGDDLLVAIYWITDLKFINQLISLANRGVNVKVIFDSSCPIRNKLIKILAKNNIYPVVSLNYMNSMHNKFIVTDNYLITGSANFTTPNLGNLHDYKTNNENILKIKSENIVKMHHEKFFKIEERVLGSYIKNIIEASTTGTKLPIWLVELITYLYFNNHNFRKMIMRQSKRDFNLIFNYLFSL
jgi:phosphatidylserine/phosphatidylglycerophosphate/cardiolipin synthase-like enzyme